MMMLVCPLNPPILGDLQASVPPKVGRADSFSSLISFFMSSIAYGASKVRYFKKFSDIYSEKLPENFAR
jgi:hypothetical protein